MRIHTGTITQIDRNALSAYLYELADSYVDEAKLWKPTNRAELERNARLLAELARGVLTGAADFARAEAYADAGAELLRQSVAQRRAITAILTPPTGSERIVIDSIDPQAAVIIGVLVTAAWIWIEVTCAKADR